jgi:hypothetical protein
LSVGAVTSVVLHRGLTVAFAAAVAAPEALTVALTGVCYAGREHVE